MSEDGFEEFNFGDISVVREEQCDELPSLVENDKCCVSRKYEFGGRRSLTMHYINKAFPDDYQTMGEKVREMGSGFFEYFNGENLKISRKYITDVFIPSDSSKIPVIMGKLCKYGGSRSNGMFGFVAEDEQTKSGESKLHIHIIHDCSYGGSHCRCSFRNEIKPYGFYKPARKFIKSIYEFNWTDWYDIFIYFFILKSGEKGKYLYITGTDRPVPSDAQLVQWRNYEAEYTERERLVRQEGNWNFDDGLGQADNPSSRETNKRMCKELLQAGTSSKRRKYESKYEKVHRKVQTLLRKKWPVPLSEVKELPEFLEDTFLIDPSNKLNVEACITNYGYIINRLSLLELKLKIEECTDPLFYPDYQYGNVEESEEIINQLLLHQNNDDPEEVSKFLNDLVDLLDRRQPKYNCLTIISQPSAGKGFFFDMLCAICQNYGGFGTANKHDLFAFQTAYGKRLIMWNEANYERGETSTLKKLFGGDAATVRKKYCTGDTNVKRTPIIVNANKDLLYMFDEAFNDRVKVYYWNPAPFLKKIPFKPHPMCFYNILSRYNVTY